MTEKLPAVLTYAAVTPLFALQAAGWVLIAGAAVVSNLVATRAVEVPSALPKDQERAVA
jgi:hypothetical protein